MSGGRPGSGSPGSPPPRPGHVDRRGRYHDRGKYSPWNLGAYVVLLALVLIVFRTATAQAWVPSVLIVFILALLARYLTTYYVLDPQYLHARRFLGGQRVALEEVRQIEYASLRDLSPVGFFGSWGWRGRMWSPRIGTFDSIHTDVFGILVTTTNVPLYISPENPGEFARELSRRVRSFSGPLAIDVGDPAYQAAAAIPSF